MATPFEEYRAVSVDLSGIRMDPLDATRLLNQMLNRISDKWTMLVINSLAKGPTRFNALLRDISPVSHRMLTLTLRSLERNGLVLRHVIPTVPPQVEYELTDLSVSLIGPLTDLFLWVQEHEPDMVAAQSVFDARSS
jgi:DNA-binding HxlR family transcriptional regulator